MWKHSEFSILDLNMELRQRVLDLIPGIGMPLPKHSEHLLPGLILKPKATRGFCSWQLRWPFMSSWNFILGLLEWVRTHDRIWTLRQRKLTGLRWTRLTFWKYYKSISWEFIPPKRYFWFLHMYLWFLPQFLLFGDFKLIVILYRQKTEVGILQLLWLIMTAADFPIYQKSNKYFTYIISFKPHLRLFTIITTFILHMTTLTKSHNW